MPEIKKNNKINKLLNNGFKRIKDFKDYLINVNGEIRSAKTGNVLKVRQRSGDNLRYITLKNEYMKKSFTLKELLNINFSLEELLD